MYPFAGGRALAYKLDMVGVIGVNPVLIDMHGKLQMGEDMDQWRKTRNITRFAHISCAGVET